MNHDNCIQSYSREHDFHEMEQALMYVCLYCGQIRMINTTGKIHILREGQKQDYYANTKPDNGTSNSTLTA